MSMPTYVMLILYTVIRAMAFQQILKELRDVVAVPITLILIRSLNKGRIHAEWKTGKVTPNLIERSQGKTRELSAGITDKHFIKADGIGSKKHNHGTTPDQQTNSSEPAWVYVRKFCASSLTVFLNKVTKAVDDIRVWIYST